MVRDGLVVPAVVLIAGRSGEEDLVELLDVVLGERELAPHLEDELHGVGVAPDLLLVSASEGADRESGQDSLHFIVGQGHALDAGRGSDRLDRRDPLEIRQPLGCEVAERLPAALELVERGDALEHRLADVQFGEGFHIRLGILFRSIEGPWKPELDRIGSKNGSDGFNERRSAPPHRSADARSRTRRLPRAGSTHRSRTTLLRLGGRGSRRSRCRTRSCRCLRR